MACSAYLLHLKGRFLGISPLDSIVEGVGPGWGRVWVRYGSADIGYSLVGHETTAERLGALERSRARWCMCMVYRYETTVSGRTPPTVWGMRQSILLGLGSFTVGVYRYHGGEPLDLVRPGGNPMI